MPEETKQVIKKGRAAKSHIQNYFFNDNTNVHLIFKKTVPNAFYIKLDSIEGKKLYSFTEDYYNKLKMSEVKIDIKPNYEYYIYDADIFDFLNMDEQGQKDYLKNMIYDGMCIGEVKSVDIQKKLYNKCIKLDREYHGFITQSDLIYRSYWWMVNVDGDYIGILCNTLKNNAMDLEFAVPVTYERAAFTVIMEDYEPKIKDTGLFILKNATAEEKSADYLEKHIAYNRKVNVYAKNILIDSDSHNLGLFQIYYYTNIKYNSIAIKIFWFPTFFSDLATEFRISEKPEPISKTRITTVKLFQDTLHTIADYYEVLSRILRSNVRGEGGKASVEDLKRAVRLSKVKDEFKTLALALSEI